MRHLTVENIMDYMDGMATDVEKSTVETHLVDCEGMLGTEAGIPGIDDAAPRRFSL